MSAELLHESVFFEFEHEGLKVRILDTQIEGRILYESQLLQEGKLVDFHFELLEDRKTFHKRIAEVIARCERPTRS